MNNELARRVLGYAAGVQNTANIVPEFQPFQTGKNKGFGQLGNYAINLPGQVVNQVYGQGIMAPTMDITRMAQANIQNRNLPNYNTMLSGPARLGYNYQGINRNNEQVSTNIARTLLPLLAAKILSRAGSVKGSTGYTRDNLGRFSLKQGVKTQAPFVNNTWKSSLR
jgi:hypothetical protein